MKKWNSLYFSFLLVTSLALVVGCSLDEASVTDTSPALTLQAAQNLSLNVLSWDPVKVTGFKEYIILQSTSDIPNNPIPTVNSDVSIIKRIKDVDITNASVSALLSTPNVHYKLYCAVDDRFLYSSTISLQQDFTILDGFYDNACHETGVDDVVMFDRINHHLTSYNYKTEEITNTVNEIVLNFPSMEMSTWENTTNVFGFDQSPAWLRKYNYPALNASASKNFTSVLWATNVNDQFVYTAVEESFSNFQVLSRTNLNVIASTPGLTGNQNIAVFPGNPVTVLTLGTAGSKKYTIGPTGAILSKEEIPTTISQPDLQSRCANGTELFIVGPQGTIINRAGEIAGFLSTSNSNFISLTRLSPDDKKAAYVLSDNSNTMRLEVVDLTHLPSVTTVSSYEIPTLNYADIIIENDILYLIGANFISSQPQTFVLKYPM